MIDGQIKIDLTRLEGLKTSLVNKILRKATTQAARIMRDAVKNSAQAIGRYGFTAKSIGVRVKTYQGSAVAIVGPRSKWVREQGIRTRGKHKGEPIRFRPSYTAHLIENATKRSKAKPFLKPALESTTSRFLEALASNIETGIANQLSK